VRGFALIHKRFGIEKIGIHQTGKNHPDPQRHRALGRQPGWAGLFENFLRRRTGQRFLQIALLFPLLHPAKQRGLPFLRAIPVRQAGMMACNQVGKNAPIWPKLFHCVDSSRRRVIHSPWRAFDMCFSVVTADFLNVVLKCCAILAQIVP
jgi:hypothetical protein